MVMLPDGTHGPHTFVDDLNNPELEQEDFEHLSRSLRMKKGDPITICDGKGNWRTAHFSEKPERLGVINKVPEQSKSLTVGFVVTKGDKPSLVIQKLTELGIDRIVLLSSERSVVRWDKNRSEKQILRLGRIAREAAMQSRQVRIPLIEGIQPIKIAMQESGVALAHFGGAAPTLSNPTIFIGPEGGWSQTELGGCAKTVTLGGSVLRSETAAIAAGTVLVMLRNGLLAERLE